MKKIIPVIMSAAMLLSSCKTADVAEKKHGGLTVYASFYAMEQFARVIGGDEIVCHSVAPQGSEPHDFEPTAADIAKLNRADLFVYSGYGIDEWVNDVAAELHDSVSVVCASEHVETDGNDPHVWLSMANAKEQLKTICDALSVTDEANFSKYRERLSEYIEKIDALEAEYKNAGFEGKKLFVTHGAYGYLCDEFGMEQVALEGIFGESDPSPAQMAEIVEQIKADNAKCIFYDPLEGDKIASAAAKEAGVEAVPLYTFEGDSEQRDYIEIMQTNLENLKKGLL